MGAGTVDEKTDVMGKQDSDISCKEVHIDHEKGLTYCGGSEDFLKEIISMYAADDKRAEIQKAYDEKDWDGYRILIHTVKSTSRKLRCVPPFCETGRSEPWSWAMRRRSWRMRLKNLMWI